MTNTTIEAVRAGNTGRVTATITALPGHGPLDGTTVLACVTDSAGVSTPLAAAVVEIGDDTVTVAATWDVPDDAARGSYTMTIDTSGPLVAAVEVQVYVEERTEPNVPPLP